MKCQYIFFNKSFLMMLLTIGKVTLQERSCKSQCYGGSWIYLTLYNKAGPEGMQKAILSSSSLTLPIITYFFCIFLQFYLQVQRNVGKQIALNFKKHKALARSFYMLPLPTPPPHPLWLSSSDRKRLVSHQCVCFSCVSSVRLCVRKCMCD